MEKQNRQLTLIEYLKHRFLQLHNRALSVAGRLDEMEQSGSQDSVVVM